ncbi:hypothetical protein BEWA_024560 [Theileria equi strain WA]|uniref:Uncharacterized protein n=1 Tax=Theileria equi strain WA TaxID=1537102 RepID=L0AVH0_THEEQ|nr:hypothetical protein BEWA_024560 [Theileria equi strain WA]AFZ79607.1 hypothetical protein BEWA_024560 [Theileria equi strain WA]|eukprot:XP_004829273.1 hypothetical protein BEWA_024560 [Theileria equi strain WA]
MVRWWIFGYDWTRYVTVDIAKSLNSEGVQITGNGRDKQYGTHYYKDGNSTVYLRESPFKSSSLQGYSRLVHTLQPDTHTYRYLLKEVQYNSIKQNIIGSIESTHFVTAVYLCHDKGRKIPLMICLLKYPGYSRYLRHDTHYYVRKSGIEPNKWQYDRSVTSDGKVLTETLKKILEQCNYPSVLNAERTSGSYFIDGENGQNTFKLYTIPKFAVKKSENDPVQGYVKYTHTLGNGYDFRIFSTTHKKACQKFADKDFYKKGPFKEASFYYWAGDKDCNNPLLLKLTSDTIDISYYILDSTNKWKEVTISKTVFQGMMLLDLLDTENCRKNKAVILNISQTDKEDFVLFSTSCQTNLNISKCPTKSQMYDRYYQSLASGYKLGRFTQKGHAATLDSLELPLTDTSVFVFHYPKSEDGKPFLIYLRDSRKSYKNTNDRPYEWKLYTRGITDENDEDRIRNILELGDSHTDSGNSFAKEESDIEIEIGTEGEIPTFENENTTIYNTNLWHLLWLVPIIIIIIILLILYCYYYLRDPWVRQI